MPWDLIFYGSMAIIFIGIIAASARARRGRKNGLPADATPTAGRDRDGGAP